MSMPVSTIMPKIETVENDWCAMNSAMKTPRQGQGVDVACGDCRIQAEVSRA